jgi:glycosyltransferase involved in cell wall biosynthesis
MFDPARLDGAFVEAKRREWGVEPGDFVTMSVGRITPLKGFDNVIRDFAEKGSVAADGRRRKLVIVGGADKDKGRCLQKLEALAAKLCAPGSVVFAGRQEKIPECISIADEIVSGNMAKPESFGLSVAEALAMGKPVRLMRRFGGAAEILDDVEAAGKPSTREAIRDLYGFDAMMEKTLAVYREVAR